MRSSFVDAPGTFRPMLWLTLPVLAEQMLHILVGFTDLWLTGNYLQDEAYVAAMTLMIYALWLVGNVFGFVALGSTAMIARFAGARDQPMVNRVMNQSITSGLIWSIMLIAMTFPFAAYFPLVMGLKGTAAAAATQYLRIEICVLPAVMVERVAVACLRGAGDMVSGLAVMAIVNLINMVTSYSLCRGVGPLPELGWTGIALGTAIGHCCGATILLTLLACGRAGFHLQLSAMRPDFDLIRRILRIGIPGGIDVLLVSICHLIYLRIVLSLGDVAAAAHGVAIQVEALGYMPGGAFQISAATMAGQYIGARDVVRARSSVVMACGVATGVMVAAGLFFYVAATPLAGLFLKGQSETIIPLAAHLLRVVAFAMAPLALVMVLVGALRGAGDTRWPLVLNLIGIVFFRVPLAMYLSHGDIYLPLVDFTLHGADLGVVGAWYAAIIDIVVRCVLLMLRFRHDAWQAVEV
ncbi:MAG TPA: MATE family efflux transporter [Lacipirellulaceae bacterium]|jgi:putative MATE family efflux protein|nr:MATE family efflux transporter [Lacipirellulaceae bacterium]